MKIDCHIHLMATSRLSNCYVSKQMTRSMPYQYLFRQLGLNKVKTSEEQDAKYASIIAKHIKKSQLDKGVLLAFDEVYGLDNVPLKNKTHMYVSGNYVCKIVKQYPDLFLYGASINPLRKDALEQLEKAKEDGAVLVKLLPNSQNFDPANPMFIPYYKKASDLKLPLLFHCGFEHTIPAINQKFGEPLGLVSALEQGTTIIVAHAGSSGLFHMRETFGDFLKLIEKYPNCYGDTSALTNIWRSKYLFQLLDKENLNKKYNVNLENPFDHFIHGSDYPIPITPFAFLGKTGIKTYFKNLNAKNPLQLDVELKRSVGVPEKCLHKTASVLNVK